MRLGFEDLGDFGGIFKPLKGWAGFFFENFGVGLRRKKTGLRVKPKDFVLGFEVLGLFWALLGPFWA